MAIGGFHDAAWGNWFEFILARKLSTLGGELRIGVNEFARADKEVSGEPGGDLLSGGDSDPARAPFGTETFLCPCSCNAGAP